MSTSRTRSLALLVVCACAFAGCKGSEIPPEIMKEIEALESNTRRCAGEVQRTHAACEDPLRTEPVDIEAAQSCVAAIDASYDTVDAAAMKAAEDLDNDTRASLRSHLSRVRHAGNDARATLRMIEECAAKAPPIPTIPTVKTPVAGLLANPIGTPSSPGKAGSVDALVEASATATIRCADFHEAKMASCREDPDGAERDMETWITGLDACLTVAGEARGEAVIALMTAENSLPAATAKGYWDDLDLALQFNKDIAESKGMLRACAAVARASAPAP